MCSQIICSKVNCLLQLFVYWLFLQPVLAAWDVIWFIWIFSCWLIFFFCLLRTIWRFNLCAPQPTPVSTKRNLVNLFGLDNVWIMPIDRNLYSVPGTINLLCTIFRTLHLDRAKKMCTTYLYALGIGAQLLFVDSTGAHWSCTWKGMRINNNQLRKLRLDISMRFLENRLRWVTGKWVAQTVSTLFKWLRLAWQLSPEERGIS